MNESCHTYEWVMACWGTHSTSHVTHLNASRHTHATHINESWRTHMNESRHKLTNESWHTPMNESRHPHATHNCQLPPHRRICSASSRSTHGLHNSISHVTRMNESFHTHGTQIYKRDLHMWKESHKRDIHSAADAVMGRYTHGTHTCRISTHHRICSAVYVSFVGFFSQV